MGHLQELEGRGMRSQRFLPSLRPPAATLPGRGPCPASSPASLGRGMAPQALATGQHDPWSSLILPTPEKMPLYPTALHFLL